MRYLEHIIPQLIQQVKHEIYARPLFLGGVSASGGGAGSPPGGYIGYLPQTRVAFDETEAETDFIPISGSSLLDNLNRIRFRIKNLEENGITGDFVPTSGGTMYGNLDMDANIVLSGSIISPTGSGVVGTMGEIVGVYTNDWQFPLFYDAFNKLFLMDKDPDATVTYNPSPIVISNGGIFSSGEGYAVFAHNNSDVTITVEFPADYSHWNDFILQMLPNYYATSFKIEGRQTDGNWYTIADVTNYDKAYYAIRVHDFYSGSVNWEALRVTLREFYNATYVGVMRLWWVSRKTNTYFPQYLSIENGGKIYGEVTFSAPILSEDAADFDDDVNFNGAVYANGEFVITSGNVEGITGDDGSLSFDGHDIYIERNGELIKLNQENTDDVPEGSNNLYFTNERVSNNSDVVANTNHRNTISGNPHHVTTEDVGAIGGRGDGITNRLSKWRNSADIEASIVYDNGDRVGVGTDSPIDKLHVYSGNMVVENVSPTILLVEDGNQVGSIKHENDILYITASGGSSEITLGDNGKVGINTVPTSAQVTVSHGENIGEEIKSYAEDVGTISVDQRQYRYINANGTYYSRGMSFTDEKAVAAGVTDYGFMVGFWGQAFARGQSFGKLHEGVLNSVYGGVVYAGIYNPNATGTVNTTYGLQLGTFVRGGHTNTVYTLYLFTSYYNGTVGTLYGIYQKDTHAINYFGGKIGVGTTSPTSKLDVNDNRIRIRSKFTPSSSNDSNGNVGDIAWDDNYIYVKTTNGWKRATLQLF